MHITRHAQTRSQQRSVSREAIDFALDYGRVNRSRDHASVYQVTDRVLDRLGLPRDHALRGTTVVAVDDTIVTVWKNAHPRRSGEGRRLRDASRKRELDRATRAWRSRGEWPEAA